MHLTAVECLLFSLKATPAAATPAVFFYHLKHAGPYCSSCLSYRRFLKPARSYYALFLCQCQMRTQVLTMVNNQHYLYRMTVLVAITSLASVVSHGTLYQTILPAVISCAHDKVSPQNMQHTPLAQAVVFLWQSMAARDLSSACLHICFVMRSDIMCTTWWSPENLLSKTVCS